MPKYSDITLAILAGGNARRMGGQNKALLEYDGETFIKRIHKNLSPLFQSTIIISNSDNDFNIANTIVFSDIIKGIGPLGGIHSALVNSKTPLVFIVSCDMPFADGSIAEMLIHKHQQLKPEILIPVINDYNEPLFAIYSKTLINSIKVLVSGSAGRPIKDLLINTNTLFIKLEESPKTKKCFKNINSIEDFQALEQ